MSTDRFIPRRPLETDLSLKYSMRVGFKPGEDGTDTNKSCEQYRKDLQSVAFGEENHKRVLDVTSRSEKSESTKVKEVDKVHRNPLNVLHSGNWLSSNQPPAASRAAARRKVSDLPSKMLDAPDIVDDFYLSVLSWGSNNIIAVGLMGTLYSWNATNSDIGIITELNRTGDFISSVKWSPDGRTIAVGSASAELRLYDAETFKCTRFFDRHDQRISTISWQGSSNPSIFTSGDRHGEIWYHDTRAGPSEFIKGRRWSDQSHSQDVCGMQWSGDGRFLATGSNDNLLMVWDERKHQERPLYRFDHHAAAVKAIAWCPWNNNLLASGGGTADRYLRFWNISTGTCINEIDTKSQVCGIQWSVDRKELVSSHGFSQNQITLWDYNSMSKITELTGHTKRVLYLDRSPDGQTIVSAAGDETLRFWDIWKKEKKAIAFNSTPFSSSSTSRYISSPLGHLDTSLPLSTHFSKRSFSSYFIR